MSSSTPALVTIPNTEMHLLSSSIINQEFSIYIALPETYSKSNNPFPVLYALDANATFGTLIETVRLFNFFNEIPEMVIIGIGYPVENIKELQGFRTRDLTPTETNWYSTEFMPNVPDAPADEGSGGAAKFLRFIREELTPFVNAKYRIDPDDSMFLGFSFCGLFGLYTLFTQPNTFARYLLGSPSIWWDNGSIFNFENEFASQNRDLSTRLHLSIGGKEDELMISDMYKMANLLRSREYDGLKIVTHKFEGETHISNTPAFISWALREAFL